MRIKLHPSALGRTRLPHRWKPILVLAGFAALIFWAASAGPGNLDARQAQAKRGAAATRPIPGAGTTLQVAALVKIIDNEIALRLSKEKIKTSPPCDDSEFIRRVYLDVVGVIPPADKVKAFLASNEPNKREKLIDALLADSRFGKQQAEIWMHQIISPTDPDNRLLPAEDLRRWLENDFNKDTPWNKMVADLLTASGDIKTNPATMLFIANKGADRTTGQVSRLFLGVQLQCAQCHNHPFTDWKQDEFWGMAAFFAKVQQTGTAKAMAKKGTTITIAEKAPAKAAAKAAKKKGAAPEGQKIVPAKFLGGEPPALGTGLARPVLAKWLSAPDNPYLAKAMVNRMWAHFFGRGFVNPIDDMHADNPATHPELLLAMAEQFQRHNFSLKFLVKSIVMSATYQRTSRPFQGNEADTELFSRTYVRVMSPEQLYDSIVSIVGNPGKGDLFDKNGIAGGAKKGIKGTPREQFVRFFEIEDGADPLEYQDGIPQALRMMNGPMFNNGGPTLTGATQYKTTPEAVDYLYLVVLARHPTVQETQRLVAYAEKKDKRTAYTDMIWTLLNSSEFRFNH